MKYSDIAAEIRARLTMSDVCSRYGIHVNPNGFALCPFHAEDTPSFRVYDGRKGFCCFGCGAGGSVIDFAMLQNGGDFKEAIRQLNRDFNLGLLPDEDERIRRNKDQTALFRQAREAALAKRAELERKAAREKARDEYFSALDRYLFVEHLIARNAPAAGAVPLPTFKIALANRGKVHVQLEEAEARWRRIDAQG